MKMDVKGAEYPILEEVVSSGIVCKKHGLKFNFLLEYHLFAKNFSPAAPEKVLLSILLEGVEGLSVCRREILNELKKNVTKMMIIPLIKKPS